MLFLGFNTNCDIINKIANNIYGKLYLIQHYFPSVVQQ